MIVNKGSRKSKNVQDVRSGKGKTKNTLAIGHSRQVFDPELTRKLTYVSNRMANADRLANKGKGAQEMKSPAKKAPSDRFEKDPKTTKKQDRVKVPSGTKKK